MSHSGISSSHRDTVHRASAHPLLIGVVPLLFAVSALAAEPAVAATAASAVKPKATPALDLRTPPITETMTQAQIDDVLAKAVEPRHVEEVEVDSSRMRDPDMQDYIPPGFASLFWALGRPSGLWRIFTPTLVQKTHSESITPATSTGPSQPAPGIPAMAGEMPKVDH
jgi:hypothetical protein